MGKMKDPEIIFEHTHNYFIQFMFKRILSPFI